MRRSIAALAFAAAPLLGACGGGEFEPGHLVDLSHPYGADTLYWPTDERGFEYETLAAGRAQSPIGVRYLFRLNLLESTSDRMPATQGDLRGRYEPANGGPVVHTRDEVRPVQIGRRLTTP